MQKAIALLLTAWLLQHCDGFSHLPRAAADYLSGFSGGVREGIEEWDTITADGTVIIRMSITCWFGGKTKSISRCGFEHEAATMNCSEDIYWQAYHHLVELPRLRRG